MFDPIKRTGELYQKFMYRKRCGKGNSLKRTHSENENLCLSVDDLMTFLKDCILPRDRAGCIEMLKKSKVQRLNDLRQDKRILKSSFELYISNHDLVRLSCIYMKKFGNSLICYNIRFWRILKFFMQKLI